MKTILLPIMLAMATAVCGQTVSKHKKLKTTDFGNQRLEAIITNSDTTYVMFIATGNRFQKYLSCDLGNRERALHLLTFLYELEVDGEDVVDLENDTHNMVTKNGLGGLRVFSEGKALSGQLRKPNIRGFIRAIKEFNGMEVEAEE